jgi:hypothetical protein
VIVPGIVLRELSHELAPASVQRWVAAAPDWLEVEDSPAVALSAGIHKGEAAAIALAARLHAERHWHAGCSRFRRRAWFDRFRQGGLGAQTHDIPNAALFAG